MGAAGGPTARSGLASNAAAALAYVLGLITGIVFLVLEPYKHDRFVRFHAMQSILFCAAAIVFSIAWNIVWGILFSISGSLIFIDVPLRLAISLGLFLFWLFVMYQDIASGSIGFPSSVPLRQSKSASVSTQHHSSAIRARGAQLWSNKEIVRR